MRGLLYGVAGKFNVMSPFKKAAAYQGRLRQPLF